MRERQFIEQNKAKWREFEMLVANKESDPEKLGKLFVQITDDLSYARTFYPNRSVRVYLNKLAQSVFDKLYKSRKRKKNRFLSFFADDIPSAVFHARKELLVSTIIFVVSVCIGIFSAIQDPDFTKSILSDDYVQMTEDNIAKNDPMAVYKGDNQFSMFTMIAANNLRIDFMTFVSGLAFGLWTILMLVYNGIMVGAFQFFFAERGLFSESFLTIWMHGALEMSAAVIAGGSGLILGRGLMFPGTYNRLQSLMIAAKQGLKILLIAVAMTTLAAFIESFVTRYTGMSNVVRLFWIVLSFAFVLGYFVVLPFMKWKRNTLLPKPVEKLQEELNFDVGLKNIKTLSKIFSDGFAIYRKILPKYLPLITIVSILYVVLNLFLNYEFISDNFIYYPDYFTHGYFATLVWSFDNLGSIFSVEVLDLRLPINAVVLLVSFCFCYISFTKFIAKNNDDNFKEELNYVRLIFVSILLVAVCIGAAFLPTSWLWLLILTPMPMILSFMSALIVDGRPDFSIKVMTTKFWNSVGLYYCFVLICSIIFTLLTFVIFSVFQSFGHMLFSVDGINGYKITIATYLFFCCFALLFVIPPIIYGFSMLYYSNREIITGHGLQEKLSFLDVEEE